MLKAWGEEERKRVMKERRQRYVMVVAERGSNPREERQILPVPNYDIVGLHTHIQSATTRVCWLKEGCHIIIHIYYYYSSRETSLCLIIYMIYYYIIIIWHDIIIIYGCPWAGCPPETYFVQHIYIYTYISLLPLPRGLLPHLTTEGRERNGPPKWELCHHHHHLPLLPILPARLSPSALTLHHWPLLSIYDL